MVWGRSHQGQQCPNSVRSPKTADWIYAYVAGGCECVSTKFNDAAGRNHKSTLDSEKDVFSAESL